MLNDKQKSTVNQGELKGKEVHLEDLKKVTGGIIQTKLHAKTETLSEGAKEK